MEYKIGTLSTWIKVEVNNKYTYLTNFDVEVGDDVVLPSPSWIEGKDTYKGIVTGLHSSYSGECKKIISVSRNKK